MRIVFIGSPPFARATFERLLDRGLRPVALVTAPVRGAGRGRKPAANPLAERARAEGLPVFQPQHASAPDFLAAFAALEPDLALVVAYGQILSDAFLAVPRQGCINLHASLLPRWRGASPVQAAIRAGDRETGVTLQRVVARLDAGPLLAARRLSIRPRETAPELSLRLATAGAALTTEFLKALGDAELPPGEAQDEEQATHCRKLRRSEAWIDWKQDALAVDRQVRALAGWPVAETTLPEGGVLKILTGSPEAGDPGGVPGTVLATRPALRVACGKGVFRALRVQRPGRAALEVGAFLRGTPLAGGSILGTRRPS